MNLFLKSASSPPQFSPFSFLYVLSLTAAFCDYFSSSFALSPLALTSSRCPVSVFLCHLPLFSLSLWKVLSKSTLCTKAVWWDKLAAGQNPAPRLVLLLCVGEQRSLNRTLLTTPLFPPRFLFPLLHFLFSEETEWVKSVRSRRHKCLLSNTHTQSVRWLRSCRARTSERGVSGNLLEHVSEGLVNRSVEKKGEEKRRERKRWQTFQPIGPLSDRRLTQHHSFHMLIKKKHTNAHMCSQDTLTVECVNLSWRALRENLTAKLIDSALNQRHITVMKGLTMNASHATHSHRFRPQIYKDTKWGKISKEVRIGNQGVNTISTTHTAACTTNVVSGDQCAMSE